MKKILRKFLMDEMFKINKTNINQIKNNNIRIYIKAYTQAKFDLLMDIDQKLQLETFKRR